MTNRDENTESYSFSELYSLMDEEVTLLRELLGLLKEQELAILKGEEKHMASLAEQRSVLSKSLKDHQKKRASCMRLCLSSFSSNTKENNLSSQLFSDAMASCDEFGSAALSLKDQILLLNKKIETQKAHIDTLFSQESPQNTPKAETLPMEDGEKTSLQTIDPEDPIESET